MSNSILIATYNIFDDFNMCLLMLFLTLFRIFHIVQESFSCFKIIQSFLYQSFLFLSNCVCIEIFISIFEFFIFLIINGVSFAFNLSLSFGFLILISLWFCCDDCSDILKGFKSQIIELLSEVWRRWFLLDQNLFRKLHHHIMALFTGLLDFEAAICYYIFSWGRFKLFLAKLHCLSLAERCESITRATISSLCCHLSTFSSCHARSWAHSLCLVHRELCLPLTIICSSFWPRSVTYGDLCGSSKIA